MKKIWFGLVAVALLAAGCGSNQVATDGTASFTVNGQTYQVQNVELSIGSGNATVSQLNNEDVVKVQGSPASYSFELRQIKSVRDDRAKHTLDDVKPSGYYPSLDIYWYATAADPINYLQSTKVDTSTSNLQTFHFGVDTQATGFATYTEADGQNGNFSFQVNSISNNRAQGSFSGTIHDPSKGDISVTNGSFDVPVQKLY